MRAWSRAMVFRIVMLAGNPLMATSLRDPPPTAAHAIRPTPTYKSTSVWAGRGQGFYLVVGKLICGQGSNSYQPPGTRGAF